MCLFYFFWMIYPMMQQVKVAPTTIVLRSVSLYLLTFASYLAFASYLGTLMLGVYI